MCNDTRAPSSYLLHIRHTHEQASNPCCELPAKGLFLSYPFDPSPLQSLYFAHMKTKYTMCPGTYGMMIMLPSQTLGISHLDQIILPCCLMFGRGIFSLVLFLQPFSIDFAFFIMVFHSVAYSSSLKCEILRMACEHCCSRCHLR